MTYTEIIGQGFGILGMMSYILSFQAKKNYLYFIFQSFGATFFALNFFLIGAYTGFAMNVVNIIRSLLLSKSDRKLWKFLLAEFLCIGSVAGSLALSPETGIHLVFTLITLAAQSFAVFVLWRANGTHIRYNQLFLLSPAWLAYDILNFTPGGIICETSCMISVIVSFVRHGKEGFEK